MMISILLLAVFLFLAWKAAPREKEEDSHIHGAGQIGLLAVLALFGVDYFTSYFYATGEMMHALHPYGLEKYGYIAIAVIARCNCPPDTRCGKRAPKKAGSGRPISAKRSMLRCRAGSQRIRPCRTIGSLTWRTRRCAGLKAAAALCAT